MCVGKILTYYPLMKFLKLVVILFRARRVNIYNICVIKMCSFLLMMIKIEMVRWDVYNIYVCYCMCLLLG